MPGRQRLEILVAREATVEAWRSLRQGHLGALRTRLGWVTSSRAASRLALSSSSPDRPMSAVGYLGRWRAHRYRLLGLGLVSEEREGVAESPLQLRRGRSRRETLDRRGRLLASPCR